MKQQQKPFIRIRLFVWSPKPRRVKDLFEEKKKMGSENNNKSNEVSRTQNNKIHDNPYGCVFGVRCQRAVS